MVDLVFTFQVQFLFSLSKFNLLPAFIVVVLAPNNNSNSRESSAGLPRHCSVSCAQATR